MENQHNERMLKEQKKQRRKIITWIALGLTVVLLAALPMLASGSRNGDEQQASILSGTAEYRDIDTQIIGGGLLASEAAEKLEIPEEVKLTEYLVGNGDTVSEGDPIATVDRVSVMTAITGVQETLDYLSEEILDAENDTASNTVKATAGGTVKVIYAQVGDDVEDVMLEHGALAAISLDDVMAVQVERASALDVGASVCVTFDDGSETSGRVSSNVDGVLTITMDDDDYAVGEMVTVFTEDGDRLGKGSLYIYNQWNAVAYSGTVTQIQVTEGKQLYSGQELMRLEVSGHTSEFQRLIDKRQEYEEMMQELFVLYRTETITAPCDGIVTGVDKDGAFLLADDGGSWFLDLLTTLGKKNDGFTVCGVTVEALGEDGMTLAVTSGEAPVEDLSKLSQVSLTARDQNRSWSYTGDVTVYVQSADGILRPDGTAKPGDQLLAVGDAEQVYWFVRWDGEYSEAAKERTADRLSDSSSSTNTTIVLTLNKTMGTAKEPFYATLSATAAGVSGWVSSSWSVIDGALPAGIQLDGSNGLLYGMPTTPGTYPVTVQFAYLGDDNETHSVAQSFTLTIAAPYEIVTAEIPSGTVGVPYSFTMQISGSDSGKWSATNLPGGLVMNEAGVISGTPIMSGPVETTVTYVDDNNKGAIQKTFQVTISGEQIPGQDAFGGMTGMTDAAGSMSGFGGSISGFGGLAAEEDDNLYSLEKLTIASVTSQEQMTVDVTIDELDITKISIGQEVTITIDSLPGETFPATVTEIANSGENEGGNSKFTVEMTLDKSSKMLPGFTATAYVVLNTAEDVLSVPAAAICKVDGKYVVYTGCDEDAGSLTDPVEVTMGVADADYVQVTGLEPGQAIWYSYYEYQDAAQQPMQMPFQ